MGFPSMDTYKIRGEYMQAAADLFENTLTKPPTPNILELWKEHQHIRKELMEISAKQSLLADTDVRLSKTRTQEDLTCFLNWADKIGIKRFGVTVAECREVNGLGLLAEEKISEKDCCLMIPRNAMISTDLARKSSMTKNLFEQDSIVRNMANVGLALFLCAQWIKADSKWSPYLKVLPNVYTTPLFYTEEELQIPALIPMLDMANHETVLGTEDLGETVSYSTEMDCAEVLATRDLQEGEWVGMFYGRRSSAEHLLHNGFVPAGDNPFDSYKLKINLSRSDKMFKEKQKFFMKMGFNENSNVYIHRIGLGPHPFHQSLEHFARIYVADDLEKYLLSTRISKRAKETESEIIGMQDVDVMLGLASLALAIVSSKTASESDTLVKAVNFLKNRFAILERSYGVIAVGKSLNEKNMERLKNVEVAILKNARIFCENWEKALLEATETNISS
ncbi:hypothetical protein DICVIV_08560 [Dictyocaulus viviparus]|uniref:protein-histidine N-methyltransferase n=1 Tax=Dictyocaulus viviparus TaxID=29172 RepID=A0A0D8XL85_DICVI|nr:hypothetical protein DICVIV_08560 [Dictyocaulus viviparus]